MINANVAKRIAEIEKVAKAEYFLLSKLEAQRDVEFLLALVSRYQTLIEVIQITAHTNAIGLQPYGGVHGPDSEFSLINGYAIKALDFDPSDPGSAK